MKCKKALKPYTKEWIIEEFEKVVLQEINMHNKQIEVTNQSIQNLENKIEEIIQDHACHIARLESKLWNIEGDLHQFKKDFSQSLKRFDTLINNVSDDVEDYQFDLHNRMDCIEANSADEEQMIEALDQIQNQINSFEQAINIQKFYIHSELQSIKEDLKREFHEYKKIIEEMPSEIPKVQKDLENKIACHAVDVKGISKEFDCLKKQLLVATKKIENIYTLIGRTEKGGKKPECRS